MEHINIGIVVPAFVYLSLLSGRGARPFRLCHYPDMSHPACQGIGGGAGHSNFHYRAPFFRVGPLSKVKVIYTIKR